MNKKLRYAVTTASILTLLAAALPAEAQRRGAGGGGKTATSISRPAGGASAGSMNRANTGSMSSANRANTGAVKSGNKANTGNVNSGNRVNTGNVNSGNKVNTGNINTGDVNVNHGDINIDVDNGWNGSDWDYHPVAAGMVIGATAAVTAAAMGSMYYALPPSGCSPFPYSTYTYYHCGSVYYRPQYQGDTVVYVVVDKPG